MINDALKRVRLWAEHGLRSELSDLVAVVSHIDALEAEVARLRADLNTERTGGFALSSTRLAEIERAALEDKP
jgi:hypothetical protein